MKNPARLQVLANDMSEPDTRTVGDLRQEASRRFSYANDAMPPWREHERSINAMLARKRAQRRVRGAALVAAVVVSAALALTATRSWIAAASYAGLLLAAVLLAAIAREVLRGFRLRRRVHLRQAASVREVPEMGIQQLRSHPLTVREMSVSVHIDRATRGDRGQQRSAQASGFEMRYTEAARQRALGGLDVTGR